MRPTIRLLTKDDLHAAYGYAPEEPVVGVTLVLGRRLLGVAGVTCGILNFAFSKMLADCEQYPDAIILSAQKMKAILNIVPGDTVFATLDPDLPSSDRFLRYMGFTRVDGDVYIWRRTHGC